MPILLTYLYSYFSFLIPYPVFFRGSLEKAKADLPDFEGKDRVMDWRVAIDLIVKEEEDRYVFLPMESLVATFKELRLIDPKLGE